MTKKNLLVFDIDNVLGDFSIIKEKRDVKHIESLSTLKNISFKEAENLLDSTKNLLREKNIFSTLEVLKFLGVKEDKYYDSLNSIEINDDFIESENVEDIIKRISDKFIIVALTNTPFFASKKTLEKLNIYGYFSRIYSIDETNLSKPSEEVYAKISNDFEFDRGISVGDSIDKDLIPAKNSDFITVYYTEHLKTDDVVSDYVDFKVSSFLELGELLEKII